MLPIHWRPYQEFRHLDQLMDRVVSRPRGSFKSWSSLWDGRIRPALDVYETAGELVVKATIPGIKAEDVEVTINKDTLVMKGGAEEEEKEERYLLRERRSGTFHRTVALPEGLDTEKGDATFEDGILTVTFPKTERAKAREIKVKVKEASKAK